MSATTEQQPDLAESFVHRAMTADREQLKALFAEALEETAALTQENHRLREALQEARMFVGSQALGQTFTHRADMLLKHIVAALEGKEGKPSDSRYCPTCGVKRIEAP